MLARQIPDEHCGCRWMSVDCVPRVAVCGDHLERLNTFDRELVSNLLGLTNVTLYLNASSPFVMVGRPRSGVTPTDNIRAATRSRCLISCMRWSARTESNMLAWCCLLAESSATSSR